ncbi:MAG TPA: trehalase family glycosidase [Candidatus Acidoferrales bacterium]|nr:trehalase family glycosidase [Candidatus Acidoferrales bacterium]
MRRVAALAVLALVIPFPKAAAPRAQKSASEPGLAPILDYIASGWTTLTRSLSNCDTLVDPKLAPGQSALYLPADFPENDAIRDLQTRCHIQVLHLPKVIHGPGEIDTNQLSPQGLLYLEHPYVVPGGRFNEMYGWDSYFIIRGLLRENRIGLARGMVENFFFEIEHYGTFLNANRTYYLTRAQPPFLSAMIMKVYEAEKSSGQEDRAWLERGYAYAKKDYEMWTRQPHLAGSTGLSRYYDFGSGPTPESVKDESGYYRKVAGYFLLHPDPDHGYIVLDSEKTAGAAAIGREYTVQVCDAAAAVAAATSATTTTNAAKADCDATQKISLSSEYYKGDRAMRESGFDVSFRFGPFGAATQDYAPVCLNSMLYKTETDLQRMSEILGRADDAAQWRERAASRKALMQKYFWDSERGMFFDYDFRKKERSNYVYATTFYPLWVGAATATQAKAVVANLQKLEGPGGMAMSTTDSGAQWDYPYEWAPMQLIAVDGMWRYGFSEDASRASYEFLSTVAMNFKRDGTIREKYNAVTRSAETNVTAGYQANAVGFGWTNGVFLVLLHELPEDWRQRLEEGEMVK